MKDRRIGFIGPGRMGSGIIRNLLKNKFRVTVFAHRTGLELDEFVKLGAYVTNSLPRLAAENDTIMLTVPSSREVEQIILGEDGLLCHLKSNSVVIDLSTSLPSSTQAIASQLKGRGIGMLDAPMTGGPREAEKGELNLMVGGDRELYEEHLDILRCIAKNIFYVGPNGSGHVVKLVNNFLGMVNTAAVSEILPLATKCGVDLDALYNVVLVSGGNSRVFERNVPLIFKRNFDVSFELELARKDLVYVSQLGREQNVPLYTASSALAAFDLAVANGLGKENTTSLVKLWEKIADVTVKAEGRQVRNDGRSAT